MAPRQILREHRERGWCVGSESRGWEPPSSGDHSSKSRDRGRAALPMPGLLHCLGWAAATTMYTLLIPAVALKAAAAAENHFGVPAMTMLPGCRRCGGQGPILSSLLTWCLRTVPLSFTPKLCYCLVLPLQLTNLLSTSYNILREH